GRRARANPGRRASRGAANRVHWRCMKAILSYRVGNETPQSSTMRLSGDLFTRCRKMVVLTRVRRCREVGPGIENVARQVRQRNRRAPAALCPKRWKARVGWLGSEAQSGVGQTRGDGANR